MTDVPPATDNDRMAARRERAIRHALTYASRGWPVFPCRPGGKEPATRHGFKDATTDPGQIRRWWQRNPAANLAIATGAPGPDVLDVDQRGPAGSGFSACARLSSAGLLDGAFAIVATPGGGLHAYFPGSTQRSGRLPRHHLDFRAAGGCVLAPPSTVGGRPYRLIARCDAPPAVLDWPKAARLLEPGQAAPARPRTAAPGDLSHLAALGRAAARRQPQLRPVLGRLPGRRIRRHPPPRRPRSRSRQRRAR